MKAHFNQLMEMQKRQVGELESEVQATKQTYSQTLRRLEEISNQIHQVGHGVASSPAVGAGSWLRCRSEVRMWRCGSFLLDATLL